MFNLAGKCAVVIGGTSGIGKAIALCLEARGSKTLRISSDVLDRASLQDLHDVVLSSFGHIDILINSAGATKRIPTLDCSEELWQSIMNVNLNGTLRSCQIFGETMLKQQTGRVINIASLSTFVAFNEVAAYGASKAAVGALTRSLAVEWAPHGVCVNAIAPGIFPTDLNRELLDSPRGHELIMRTPMARFGTVDEVVGAAIFLSSDESAFTTGQIIAVDGGFLASGVNQ
jgi:NAD(P)-dependent dehydrogenase (short-subunit alcohol dehydrogenase family)